MKIRINLQEKTTISLEEGKKVLQKIAFANDQSLSQKILPAIEKILSRRKLTIKAIDQFILDSEVPENYTAYRIAKTTVDALNLANKLQK